MITEEKKFWAVELLQNKCKELERLPKKDDFDVVTLSRIKAFLGPWPRALETAGLKEPKKNFQTKKGKNPKTPMAIHTNSLKTKKTNKL